MPDLHPAVATFFDELTAHMREALAGVHPDGTAVSWSGTTPESGADLTWWSCGISVDPAALAMAGAPAESWNALGRAYEAASDEALENDFSGMVRSLLEVAQIHFGNEVECTPEGPSKTPARRLGKNTSTAEIEISFRDGALTMIVALTPELVEALGGPPAPIERAPGEPATKPFSGNRPSSGEGSSPADRLMCIEVPVSVSLGRVQMRMKDVLALNSGSIVELEQELGDHVEVRVNNCVIARGEMVSVDGNYGVRVLELVSGPWDGANMSSGSFSGSSPDSTRNRKGL